MTFFLLKEVNNVEKILKAEANWCAVNSAIKRIQAGLGEAESAKSGKLDRVKPSPPCEVMLCAGLVGEEGESRGGFSA